MHILLTAFEPFGGNATNITQQVLEMLPNQVGQHMLYKAVLPVSFRRAPKCLRMLIQQLHPDCVWMMGQCGSGDQIRLERNAQNIMDSRMGDNDGFCPQKEIIDPHVPATLMATIGRPLEAIAADCQKEALPVVVSESAGRYVCNRVYFEALLLKQKALFVHIPKQMDHSIGVETINYLLQHATSM